VPRIQDDEGGGGRRQRRITTNENSQMANCSHLQQREREQSIKNPFLTRTHSILISHDSTPIKTCGRGMRVSKNKTQM
jgi:hypothetical protein